MMPRKATLDRPTGTREHLVISTVRIGRSLASTLRQAKEGRPRRKIIRRLVAELGARMWAPNGVPAWGTVAITLPSSVKLRRAAGRLDGGSWYRLELADGRSVVVAGYDLVTICAALGRLADAQRDGDEPAVRRVLAGLCGPPRR
jgi:hypothetical protein